MRLVGLLLFLLGAGGTAVAAFRSLRASRPKDLAYAFVALLAAGCALSGLGLFFEPGFFR